MSAKKQDVALEKESPSEPEPKSSTSTADTALAKLEDHRCAICQNIIINACRIACGHTFCRHCLNVDRENQNNGTKPTCFICDAAVTEIINNTDRDDEIEALYAVLPTTERLSRARAKSERKLEEENFQKRPKESNAQRHASSNAQRHASNSSVQTSSASSGSGDASFSRISYSNDVTSAGESNNENEFPTFYGGTCRMWQEDDEHDFHSDHISTRERYIESNDDFEDSEIFDRASPMIVHHTIEHVYHTLEMRNTGAESDVEGARGREINTTFRTDPYPESQSWRNTDQGCGCGSSPSCSFQNHGACYSRNSLCNNDFRCDPYMNQSNSAQNMPGFYPYQQYSYPYTPATYHPHFVPMPYHHPVMAYPNPFLVNIARGNNFCPTTGEYRQRVPTTRHPYIPTTAYHENSSETPLSLLNEQYEENENNCEEGEGMEVRPVRPFDRNGDRYEGGPREFHQTYQNLNQRRSGRPLTIDLCDDRNNFDYENDPPSLQSASNSTDRENYALRDPHIEICESREEHSDHEDHVITLSISVPRRERQEVNAFEELPPRYSEVEFGRFREISREPM